jgi:hypothetical protein
MRPRIGELIRMSESFLPLRLPHVDVADRQLADLGHQPARAEDTLADPVGQFLSKRRIGELDGVTSDHQIIHLPLDLGISSQVQMEAPFDADA